MKVKVSDPANETIADRATYLAEFAFDLADELSELESAVSIKFKYLGADISFYALLCEGAMDYSAVYEWYNVRKYIVAFKGLYRLVGRRGSVDIQPEIMVKIDELIKEIDYNIKQAKVNSKKRDDTEMEPWLKKYKIWKEMQK